MSVQRIRARALKTAIAELWRRGSVVGSCRIAAELGSARLSGAIDDHSVAMDTDRRSEESPASAKNMTRRLLALAGEHSIAIERPPQLSHPARRL